MVALESVRTFFVFIILLSVLVVASPALGVIVPLESGSERFSELWLLGPDHMAEGYPFDVGEGEEYSVFVGVGNHMGGSEYYRVCVKFTNSTEFLPDTENGVASSLPCLREYLFFVDDGEVWESAVTFGFEDMDVKDDVLNLGNVVIDRISFPVDVSAVWTSENEGYFFELFFELWRYDVTSENFTFDDQYVGLRLGVTAS
jgi:hypothetical protein